MYICYSIQQGKGAQSEVGVEGMEGVERVEGVDGAEGAD